MGGVGKTELALEFAFRHESDFMFVFWISSDNSITIYNSFREIAQQILDRYFPHPLAQKNNRVDHQDVQDVIQHLGMAGLVDDAGHISKTNDLTTLSLIHSAVMEWIKRYQGRDWLLILDNLDEEAIFRDFFPKLRTLPGQILITTRNPHLMGDPSALPSIELKRFSAELNMELKRFLSDTDAALQMLFHVVGQNMEDYDRTGVHLVLLLIALII